MKTLESTILRSSKSVIAILVMLFFVSSCGNTGQNSDEEGTDTSVTTDQIEVITPETLEEYPIPTPFEITQVLEEAGAGYIVDILNSTQDVYKYETEKKQALNLGVYGADLSYSSTYNESQETMRYLQCSQDLTDKLQIQDALTQEVLDLVADNQDNKDSLYSIIKTTFFKTFENLNNNERGNISALVLAGGWIEGLYISTQIANTANNKEKVVGAIIEQKQHLKTLVATLKTYKDDENVSEVLVKIEKITAVFDEVTESISDEQLSKISSVVEEIRNEIIQ